jgi:hypothetical protein
VAILPANLPIEGEVLSEIGLPALYHILMGISRTEWGPET